MVGVWLCVEVRKGFLERWHLARDMKRGWCGCVEIWGEQISGGGNCSAKALRRECAGSVGGTRKPRDGVGTGSQGGRWRRGFEA